MTRIDNRQPVGVHVKRAIEAAGMTTAQLIREYPHTTEKGYMRPTDTGSLYRRIGLVLLQIPAPLLEKLKAIQANVGLTKLRKLGNTKRSLQENISAVRLLIVELVRRPPIKTTAGTNKSPSSGKAA